MSSFIILPRDIIKEILLWCQPHDVLAICSSNSFIYGIWHDDDFWHNYVNRLTVKLYGYSSFDEPKMIGNYNTWQQFFKNYIYPSKITTVTITCFLHDVHKKVAVLPTDTAGSLEFRIVSIYGKKFKPRGNSYVTVPIRDQLFLRCYINSGFVIYTGGPQQKELTCKTYQQIGPNVKLCDMYYVFRGSPNIRDLSQWPTLNDTRALNSRK
jgi:hypothetical protein